MTRASISEVKNRLSALIDRVKRGDRVVITDRGRAVAVLESAIRSNADADDRLDRLERAGALRRGKGRIPKWFFTDRPPRPHGGASGLRALLDERAQGR